ncbi:MAG: sulfite exporter TauE/SafE family protein [Oligoflexia bacterium]|nr:sulfite exporter TauE/SafE family protein [Oligoflexia bacterium]
MEPFKILFLALSGILAGVLAGMFGIGGGIVLVPILVLGLGYSQHTASGMSLVALLLPVGILGAVQYFKAGKISPEQVKLGLIISLGMFAGAYFGSRLAVAMPVENLRRGFAVLLGAVALKMWFS